MVVVGLQDVVGVGVKRDKWRRGGRRRRGLVLQDCGRGCHCCGRRAGLTLAGRPRRLELVKNLQVFYFFALVRG